MGDPHVASRRWPNVIAPLLLLMIPALANAPSTHRLHGLGCAYVLVSASLSEAAGTVFPETVLERFVQEVSLPPEGTQIPGVSGIRLDFLPEAPHASLDLVQSAASPKGCTPHALQKLDSRDPPASGSGQVGQDIEFEGRQMDGLSPPARYPTLKINYQPADTDAARAADPCQKCPHPLNEKGMVVDNPCGRISNQTS